jgi:hypothetical protein
VIKMDQTNIRAEHKFGMPAEGGTWTCVGRRTVHKAARQIGTNMEVLASWMRAITIAKGWYFFKCKIQSLINNCEICECWFHESNGTQVQCFCNSCCIQFHVPAAYQKPCYRVRDPTGPDLTPSSDDPFAIHLFNMSLFVANCVFLPEGNIEPWISGNTMERERLSILNRVSLATRNLLECHDLLENL